MQKLITKGNWYYEIQILMVVIMWQHNMDYKPMAIKRPSVRWGRLYIWFDTAWTTHGVARTIREFIEDLTKNTKSFKRWSSKFMAIRINSKNMFVRWYYGSKLGRTVMTIQSFIELSRAGFRISRSDFGNPVAGSIMYRFWWNSTIIDDLGDISKHGDHWNTMLKGSSKPLSHPTPGIKPVYTGVEEWHKILGRMYDNTDHIVQDWLYYHKRDGS